MPWATCMLNIEAGKMELIPANKRVDADDPRYEQEVHIVPCAQKIVNGQEDISFGAHELTRECACHPEIREQTFGRTLILHSEKAN